MQILILSVSIVLVFFAWDATSMDKDDGEKFDNEFTKNNPMALLAQEMLILEGIKCRGGYYNSSDELTDAVHHCARMTHTKVTHLKFCDEKVDFSGATPFLCLRSCMVLNAGLVNEDRNGINETAFFNVLKKQMTLPGGEMSAFKFAKEIMECDRKHPTLFPNHFSNCTETEDFFRCTRRVFMDCNDKKGVYEKEWLEYVQTKKTLPD